MMSLSFDSHIADPSAFPSDLSPIPKCYPEWGEFSKAEKLEYLREKLHLIRDLAKEAVKSFPISKARLGQIGIGVVGSVKRCFPYSYKDENNQYQIVFPLVFLSKVGELYFQKILTHPAMRDQDSFLSKMKVFIVQMSQSHKLFDEAIKFSVYLEFAHIYLGHLDHPLQSQEEGLIREEEAEKTACTFLKSTTGAIFLFEKLKSSFSTTEYCFPPMCEKRISYLKMLDV